MSDMKRLGKKQQFKRNFSFLSTLGLISIYMATWELIILVLSAGIYNGGYGGLFWVFVGTSVCYAPIVASLAEMENMAPTSGGQYHWVSEFAPASSQKFLSYTAGWMSVLAWVASQASGPFLVTTLIQVIIQVTQPDFSFPRWQYTLIALAFLTITIGFNTWGAPFLPTLETWSLIGHVMGFIVVIVPMWAMSPKNSAHEVFLEVVNNSGWGSIGGACPINQVSVLYCILGSDTAVHISEEVEDASWVVPRCMWWSYLLNGLLALITLIIMLFTFGPLDETITYETPYLALLLNTGSNAVAIALLIILLLLIYLGNITLLATVSREAWAFARDKGFPFSGWISKVRASHLNVSPQPLVVLLSARPDHSYSTDGPEAPHTLQRRLPDDGCLRSALPHQPRLISRLQHHRLTLSHGPAIHLYDQYRLHPTEAYPRRASSRRALVSRKMGLAYQRICFCVQLLHADILRISGADAGRCE